MSTWWEVGKLYFKMLAIQYCVQMQKNIRSKQDELTQFITIEKTKANPNQDKIQEAHQHLQDIDNYKISGSIIRSKEKMILEQEKPIKFFFDQEKQKQKRKAIKQLQTIENDKIITLTNGFQILNYCKKFFSDLYTKTQTNAQIQENLLNPLKAKIANEENKKLTEQITFEELKSEIFQLENVKSPGIDGIPIEFCKSYYEYIKNDLLQLYNSILFRNDNLTTSMNQAIITLLHKNDKKENLKNWRPISLLCSDYKILTKILSNRLKPTLQHAISIEKTCGIPNRSIFSNLFTIRKIINHSNTKNINSFIISVDQEKVFDKVDREFLYQIMRKLGYSEIFIEFIKKLYQNTLSIISNNGFLSTPFSLCRGVRQGCLLSLLLYIINGEVINLNIKNNDKIVGYAIPNQKENAKLSQYADYTNLFVLTKQSIIEILNFFEQYNLATGTTINISKTTITPLANAKICNIDKKYWEFTSQKTYEQPVFTTGIYV